MRFFFEAQIDCMCQMLDKPIKKTKKETPASFAISPRGGGGGGGVIVSF